MNRHHLLLWAALWSASPAFAGDAMPPVGSAMPLGGDRRPIQAWIAFCANPKYAHECAIDPDEPRTVVLTPQVWSRIVSVDRVVNRSIRVKSDEAHFGRTDVWDLAEDGAGDCEDFALRKRQLLARSGLPMRAMRMTVVALPDGAGHAVLTIATDRGDLVLDNRSARVRPWKDTGYEFIKRESQDEQRWVAIGSRSMPVQPAQADGQICFRTSPVRHVSGTASGQ